MAKGRAWLPGPSVLLLPNPQIQHGNCHLAHPNHCVRNGHDSEKLSHRAWFLVAKCSLTEREKEGKNHLARRSPRPPRARKRLTNCHLPIPSQGSRIPRRPARALASFPVFISRFPRFVVLYHGASSQRRRYRQETGSKLGAPQPTTVLSTLNGSRRPISVPGICSICSTLLQIRVQPHTLGRCEN